MDLELSWKFWFLVWLVIDLTSKSKEYHVKMQAVTWRVCQGYLRLFAFMLLIWGKWSAWRLDYIEWEYWCQNERLRVSLMNVRCVRPISFIVILKTNSRAAGFQWFWGISAIGGMPYLYTFREVCSTKHNIRLKLSISDVLRTVHWHWS